MGYGFMTIHGALGMDMKNNQGSVHDPVLAGLITSAATPYFWIWWGSIGSAFLIAGIAGGLMMVVLFMAGHWAADIGWLTVVSGSIYRGRMILSDRWYRYLILACGIFLILFGGYYLADSVGSWNNGSEINR